MRKSFFESMPVIIFETLAPLLVGFLCVLSISDPDLQIIGFLIWIMIWLKVKE